MPLSIGIVGLPNVGKSTLFKAITRKHALIANYPFATIEPNVGTVAVPDARIIELSRISKSAQTIPTTIEFIDIAGLVAGASKGEGLGNKFLSHIRSVDAIAHVVRAFSDVDVIHVSGVFNPQDDFEIINVELAIADLETVDRARQNVDRKLRAGRTRELDHEKEVLERLHQALTVGQAARSVLLTEDEEPIRRALNLLTAKPMMIVLNCDEGVRAADVSTSERYKFLYEGGASVISISAKIEAELADLPPADAASFLKESGMEESGLDRLIRAGYELLELITFFTSGPKETRAWTVRRGTAAPYAAGVIHSDFEKGFIRAEVIGWREFVESNGEAGSRERGFLRTEGKEYIMQDGDVCHFLFNV